MNPAKIFLVLVLLLSCVTHGLNAQQIISKDQSLDIKQRSIVATDSNVSHRKNEMIIRIAEIEIHPNNLEEYKAILKEGAETSMRLEPGVISIFPMYQKRNPAQVRIVEIYANKEAYELHLKTPHFQKYKTTTAHMVKSLQLMEMEAIDTATMTKIFSKLQTNE